MNYEDEVKAKPLLSAVARSVSLGKGGHTIMTK